MRKALAAVGLLVLAATLVRGEKEIEPDALLGHIKFLAADDLKGRGNGSEGLERAADYIAEQFKSAGLQPGVEWRLVSAVRAERGIVDRADQHALVSVARQDGHPDARHELLPAGGHRQRQDTVGEARSACRWCLPATASRSPNWATTTTRTSTCPARPSSSSRTSRRSTMPAAALNGTRPMPQTSLNAKAQLALEQGRAHADRRLRSDAPLRRRAVLALQERSRRGRSGLARAAGPAHRDAAAARRLASRRDRASHRHGSRPAVRSADRRDGRLRREHQQEPQDRSQRDRNSAGQRSRRARAKPSSSARTTITSGSAAACR